MEGYIWFHKEIYGGTKSDFLEFQKKNTEAELLMKMYISSLRELETIAQNLNRSNVLTEIQSRS